MAKMLTNLCIIHQHPRILLALKKRRFGAGKWNGYGGKVEGEETMEECLHREVMEEGGIKINDPVKLGILEFEFPHSGLILENHIYKVTDFSGEPVETEEMNPKWFSVDELPFSSMWADDPYWMPLFLKNIKFKGRFVFDENEKVVEHLVEEVENL